MESAGEIAIERASIEDAAEILTLQKLAYVSEAELIDDFTIPPLHQTLEEVEAEFRHQVFLKVELDGRIVGSVRSTLEGGTCYVGKLIVHPEVQNCGIGTMLLHAAEDQFQDAKRYELFTGEKSEKNLHIYRKNGYRAFKRDVVSKKLALVYLEKQGSVP